MINIDNNHGGDGGAILERGGDGADGNMVMVEHGMADHVVELGMG